MSGYSAFKRVLVGPPLPSQSEGHQRLTKRVALAVFATDAIASTAFATQEILAVIVPVAGMAAGLRYLVPISLVVVALLVIVVSSYFQTLYAYPNGGGSYIVSRENLGRLPALFAGAALLVDYTLTVSVSIAAGVDAITSAVVPLRGHQVALGVALIVAITVANLRGAKESGRIFAPPTYLYVATMSLLVVWGLYKTLQPGFQPLPVDHSALSHFFTSGTGQAVTAFLLLRAFASGAVALSGVEAISNGVQAFKKPQSRNAALTLLSAATILGVLFVGIAELTYRVRPTLSPDQTILSQLGHFVFGHGALYIILQASTAAILTLSANTAFADFPRLSGIIARDRFMPRQLAHRGDRLVLSNGIIVLAVAAAALFVGYGGDITALIPLFAVGLFTAFTLSQAGMVVHWWRTRGRSWPLKLAINALGATTTLLVTLIVVISKFTEGAWIPTCVIPLIVVVFLAVRRHYDRVELDMAIPPGATVTALREAVIILVGEHLSTGVVQALAFAEAQNAWYRRALYVAFDPDDADQMRQRWDAQGFSIPLEIVDSPFRELGTAVTDFIDQIDDLADDDVVTVIIPEFVVRRWWEYILHNQSALSLQARLRFRPNTIVVSVPVHASQPTRPEPHRPSRP
jgi:amino acid transporter